MKEKRMRSDKKKSLSKVANTLLKEPLLSEREVAEKSDVSNGTAHNMIKELEQMGAKDDKIIAITDTDREIVELSQIIIKQSLNKTVKESTEQGGLEMSEALKASTLAKESTARYTIFRGSITDGEGGMKYIDPSMLEKVKNGEIDVKALANELQSFLLSDK